MTQQYYYKQDACSATTSADENCICWHDEGTGPFPNDRHTDDVTTLEWRMSATMVAAKTGGYEE